LSGIPILGRHLAAAQLYGSMNKLFYILLLIGVPANGIFSQIKKQYYDGDIFYAQHNPKISF
jgi:hypothetical protein